VGSVAPLVVYAVIKVMALSWAVAILSALAILYLAYIALVPSGKVKPDVSRLANVQIAHL
jgi:hypothetical protein